MVSTGRDGEGESNRPLSANIGGGMDSISTGTEDRAYCFGDYRLLPGRQLLLRGNRPVRLGTRALDLLRLLVERPGELVTKAELIRFVCRTLSSMRATSR